MDSLGGQAIQAREMEQWALGDLSEILETNPFFLLQVNAITVSRLVFPLYQSIFVKIDLSKQGNCMHTSSSGYWRW